MKFLLVINSPIQNSYFEKFLRDNILNSNLFVVKLSLRIIKKCFKFRLFSQIQKQYFLEIALLIPFLLSLSQSEEI